MRLLYICFFLYFFERWDEKKLNYFFFFFFPSYSNIVLLNIKFSLSKGGLFNPPNLDHRQRLIQNFIHRPDLDQYIYFNPKKMIVLTLYLLPSIHGVRKS